MILSEYFSEFFFNIGNTLLMTLLLQQTSKKKIINPKKKKNSNLNSQNRLFIKLFK